MAGIFALMHGDAPEPPEDDVRRVRVEAPRRPAAGEAQAEVDARSPGFARVITVDPDDGATPGDGLGRVLERAPGVRVRSVGGLGQYNAIQIRGSSPQQVQLFVEGVPLGGSFGGLVDLSSQPLDGLAQVEVYRGYVPIAFGGATLGGAVNLVGRVHEGPPTLAVSGGGGSFGTREARVSLGSRLGKRPFSVGANLSYAGSEGNFPYFSDGGTPRLTTDDATIRRRNNDYDRVFGQVQFDGRPGRVVFAQRLRGSWRDHGIAGLAALQATQARQAEVDLRSITRVTVAGRGPREPTLTWVIGLGFGRRRYRDPKGQVGVGVDDERSLSGEGLVSPRLLVPLWRGATLGLVGDLRSEVVAIDERTAPLGADVRASGDATRWRTSAGLGVELDQHLFRDVWHLVPAVRIDGFASRFEVPEGEGESGDLGRDTRRSAISPRLGTSLRAAPGVSLRGSAGRYFRVPTLYELFGDRGFVVGNEGLLPEQGWNVDGGATYDLRGRIGSFYAQVAGFASWTENLIQFVRSGPTIRPINVAGARLRGVEVAVMAELFAKTVDLDAGYTFLDSRNETLEEEQRGQPLPGRPRHEAHVRIGGGHAFGHGWRRFEPRVHYELDFIGATALDVSNRYRLGARWLHALVLQLRWAEGIHFGIELRNLSNVRTSEIIPAAGPPDPIRVPISDFIGYPLPGRSVFFRLTLDSRVLHHSKSERRS